MSTYSDIKNSRRLVWAGIVIGYGLAVGVAAANLSSDEGTPLTALAFLLGFSLSASLALISLDRRPSLLPVAAMGAVVQGVLLITSVGLVEFVPAVLWYLAAQRRPRAAATPPGATWLRPLSAAATVIPLLVMFAHLDPMCSVTGPDGTMVRTYVAEGAREGWALEQGSSSSTSSSNDGETTRCATNTIVWWEAVASAGLSAVYVALVVALWPTSEQLTRSRGASRTFSGPNARRV
jgi:hypothetical protein